jgi:predicted lipoprotein with Yx(FWY)xxD motif
VRYHARAVAAIAGTALAALTATACSGSSDSSHAATAATASPAASGATYAPEQAAHAAPATVSTKSVPLGKVLVNEKGMTLYVFEADKTSKSTCTGGCAKAWPPLTVKAKPTAAGGVDQKQLTTAKRPDSSALQVTYHGHPLYLFAGDTKSGDTNGQGLNNFGAKWYVLGTNGKEIKAAPKTPSVGGY